MAHLNDGAVPPSWQRRPAVNALPSGTPAPPRTGASAVARDLLLYAVIALLLVGAWAVTRLKLFEAGDDIGYWLGVAGGVAMLLLFSYPLRKHVKALHRWGRVKWWFLVHMLLGIGGPLLILLHSTFQIGSLNAAVALYSMLVVAGSGVVGRFLYVRINRDLHDETTTLRELQSRAGLDHRETRSRLAFAPAVEARLLAFEQRELAERRSAWTHLRQALLLGGQRALERRACSREVRAALRTEAGAQDGDTRELAERERQAMQWAARWLAGVVRVARLGAYQRLFALWHVAHVPFVYLMVISAVVHVVAVHAY